MKSKLFIIIIIAVTLISMVCLAIYVVNGVYQNRKLFEAIERDDFNGVNQAVEKGAWINARRYFLYLPNLLYTNPTPLISACKKGNTEIVSLLLDNGADVNKKDNYTRIRKIWIPIKE